MRPNQFWPGQSWPGATLPGSSFGADACLAIENSDGYRKLYEGHLAVPTASKALRDTRSREERLFRPQS